jgi:hypothetical protein
MISETILGALRRPAGPELSSRKPTRQGHLQLLQCVVRWRGVWLKSGELHIREPLGAAPADEVDESRVETWSMGHTVLVCYRTGTWTRCSGKSELGPRAHNE